MTRGRLPSGSWIEAGSRYRTRGGDVVQVESVIYTGLNVKDAKTWADIGPALLIHCRHPDGRRYAVFNDGRALPGNRLHPLDLIRRAFR